MCVGFRMLARTINFFPYSFENTQNICTELIDEHNQTVILRYSRLIPIDVLRTFEQLFLFCKAIIIIFYKQLFLSSCLVALYSFTVTHLTLVPSLQAEKNNMQHI